MNWHPITYTAKAYRNEAIVPGLDKTGGVLKNRMYIICRAHVCCNTHKTEMVAVTGTFADSTAPQTKLYYPRDIGKVLRIGQVFTNTVKNKL